MNPRERGVHQSESSTRRRAPLRIAGLAAAALVFAGGCAEIDPPQVTGREGNISVQRISEPQIDEEAARDLIVLYMAALGAGLLLLPRVR